MSYRVELLNYGEEDAWDKIVTTAPIPNPMLLAGWKAVLANAFSVCPLYLTARQGESIQAVMPLYHSRSFWTGDSLQSMDGAIACKAGEQNAEMTLVEYAMDWGNNRNIGYLFLRGYVPDTANNRTTRVLHTEISLLDGSEAVWKQLASNTKRKIRKACKNGYTISHDSQISEEFYPVFARRQRDLGTPTFGISHFREINKHLSKNLFFISCTFNGMMVGGAVLFNAGNRWLNLYLAVNREAQRDYASYLLYWDMIEFCSFQGASTLDLGRSITGSGTHHFKQQWASMDREQPYALLPLHKEIPAGLFKLSFGIKHGIWKKLPLCVAQPIGRRLRRAIPFV